MAVAARPSQSSGNTHGFRYQHRSRRGNEADSAIRVPRGHGATQLLPQAQEARVCTRSNVVEAKRIKKRGRFKKTNIAAVHRAALRQLQQQPNSISLSL